MLNILKKIPIIETIIILLLNFLLLVFGLLMLLSLGLRFEVFVELSSLSKEDYKMLLLILMQGILFAGFYISVYKNLFDISRNRLFIKLVYYLKYHKVAYRVLCTFLFIFSMSFLTLAGGLTMGLIYGILYSHAFPIIVIYLCWNILEKVKKHNVKIGKNLYNFIIWILFLVLTAGGIDWFIPRNYYHTWDTILSTLIIILVTVITVTTEQTCKVIKGLNKKILILLMLIWGIVVYESIRIFPKNMLTYYLFYLFVLVLCFLIFAPLIIKLKRKNKAFRAEVEAEVLQSIAERSNNKKNQKAGE